MRSVVVLCLLQLGARGIQGGFVPRQVGLGVQYLHFLRASLGHGSIIGGARRIGVGGGLDGIDLQQEVALLDTVTLPDRKLGDHARDFRLQVDKLLGPDLPAGGHFGLEDILDLRLGGLNDDLILAGHLDTEKDDRGENHHRAASDPDLFLLAHQPSSRHDHQNVNYYECRSPKVSEIRPPARRPSCGYDALSLLCNR